MPPSLSRSSIRYFPASICPSKESSVFSSATPSEGHNVVVSGYSAPHFGQDFIEELLRRYFFLRGDKVLLSHLLRPQHRRIKPACLFLISGYVSQEKMRAQAKKAALAII